MRSLNLIGLQELLSLNFVDSLGCNPLVGSFTILFDRNTFNYSRNEIA